MRLIHLSALLTLIATAAGAQPAASPPGAPDRVCTTTTTVVRRGEAVLSSTSTTRCEGDGAPEAKAGGAGLLRAPGAMLGALGLDKGGDSITPKNVRGDWHTIEPGSRRVCHLFLTSVASGGGYHVRTTDCLAPLSHVTAWTFDADSVGLHDAAGAPVAKLSGDREHLSGDGVVLER